MTTRERWIVYPLLLLALGAAIKPKLVPPELRAAQSSSVNAFTGRITCRELQVIGSDGRPRIQFGAPGGSAGGEIDVRDAAGNVVVTIKADPATQAGLVETLNPHGKPQTSMMSSATGGEIVAFDNVGEHSVAIGHRDGGFGLIDTNLKTGETLSASVAKIIHQ